MRARRLYAPPGWPARGAAAREQPSRTCDARPRRRPRGETRRDQTAWRTYERAAACRSQGEPGARLRAARRASTGCGGNARGSARRPLAPAGPARVCRAHNACQHGAALSQNAKRAAQASRFEFECVTMTNTAGSYAVAALHACARRRAGLHRETAAAAAAEAAAQALENAHAAAHGAQPLRRRRHVREDGSCEARGVSCGRRRRTGSALRRIAATHRLAAQRAR